MAKNNNLTDFLTSEANKFRSVLGTQGTINPQDFDDLIDDVYDKGYNDAPSGTDVSDTTAVASDVLSGKYFYLANGTKTQGSILSKSAETFTPTTTNQVITAGKYLEDDQTILGDANLLAENIKAGESIFGVSGNFSNVTEFVYGNVTPSTDSRTFTFNATQLGKNPKFIMIMSGDMALSSNNTRYISCYVYSFSAKLSGNYSQMGIACFGKSGSPYGAQVYRYPGNSYWVIDRSLDKFENGTAYVTFEGTTPAYFKSGISYTYFIGA